MGGGRASWAAVLALGGAGWPRGLAEEGFPPCGADALAGWRALLPRVREQAARFAARLPFAPLRADYELLDGIRSDLRALGVEESHLGFVGIAEVWTECAIGLLAMQVLALLTNVNPQAAPAAGAQALPAVLTAPWADVLLAGWPVFPALATLGRWASPHGDLRAAEFGGTNAKVAAQAARDFPASQCDALEVGALPAARRALGRLWRSRDPAAEWAGDAEAEAAPAVEAALASVEDGAHARGSRWGPVGCRWTEHRGRYLGALLGEGGEEADVAGAVASCLDHDACAGITIEASASGRPRFSLRRGEPLLHASPTEELSLARWCSAGAPTCPGPAAAGLLATALRRLSSGSLRDLAPELVVEAQSVVAGWAVQVDPGSASADLWATEWPIWELLRRLQQRVDALQPPTAAAPAAWGPGLRRAVGFSDVGWQLATEELGRILPSATGPPAWLRERVQCSSGRECLGELFARMHLLLYEAGTLPLRDPVKIGSTDALSAAYMERSRALLDGVDYDWGGMVWEARARREAGLEAEEASAEALDRLMPAHHALQVDRRQLANFILSIRDIVTAEPLGRCLEWDEPFLLVRAFAGACHWTDIFSYSEPSPEEPMMGMPGRNEYPHGTRHYWGDFEHPDGPGLEPDTFDLVICPFVFEHISKPFVAMRNLARTLRPGGYVVWAAPFFQQYHGSPHDYFRYTPKGARSLAESAGLEVVRMHAPGDLALTSGVMLGMLLPYWTETQVVAEEAPRYKEDSPRFPMNVFALFRKPLQ